MRGLNYQRLERITKEVPHYRGNVDRFPLLDRKSSQKYFLVVEEDGQKVFDVVYGGSWLRHVITKEEYDLRAAKGDRRCQKYEERDFNGKLTGECEYVWYETVPNVLGTVRPDNTFEFNAKRYGQGDRLFLSRLSPGWFTTKSRHGGMLYQSKEKFIPIWTGMTVNIDDMTPTEPFKVVIHHVNRKKAKTLLDTYEHFLKVSEVMHKNMTLEAFMDTTREVVDGVFGVRASYTYIQPSRYLEEAMKHIHDAPLDAFIFFVLGYDVGRVSYMMRWKGTYGYGASYESLHHNLKRRLSKELYLSNREVFNEVEYEGGLVYPACDWGTKIIVNGKEMEQYT